jgi:rubrerythrin
MSFSSWRRHFERNSRRPVPEVTPPSLPTLQTRALAWSLARFQIGEVGEGRIARDIWRVRIRGIDDDYRIALGLFVKEEGRHARILAGMVGALGGELFSRSWSQGLFRMARRMIGPRTKLMFFFAAEVIGIGFYGLLAAALPSSPLRAALEQIASDERAHLAFHRDFFQAAAPRGWRRAAFRIAWATVGSAAALTVLVEHRRTLSALGIPAGDAWLLLVTLIRAAGRPAPASVCLTPAEARS